MFHCVPHAHNPKYLAHFPAGKLMLLPTPHRPLPLDFIMDLSELAGSTVILVILDRGKYHPPKLPSAFELDKIIFVLHYFGVPEDIVSDQGS